MANIVSIQAKYFFEYDEGGRRGHTRNYLKRGPDWMLKIFHSAIEW